MDRKFTNLKLTFLIIAITMLFTSCELNGNFLLLSLFKSSETSTKSELSDTRFNGTFTKTYEGINYNWYSASYDYYKEVEETYTFDGSNKVKYQIKKRLYVLNEENENTRPTEDNYVRTVNSTRYKEFQVKDDNKYRVRKWTDFCKPADFCHWLKYEFCDNCSTIHLYITDDDDPHLMNYEVFKKVN